MNLEVFMKALHLLCRRNRTSFIGLTPLDGQRGIYRSCCWDFTNEKELLSLVGGWLYLHPESKSQPSAFGGIVCSIEPTKLPGKAHEDRYAFIFEVRKEGRRQRWRGAEHGMAWTGGLVEATYPHEQGG
jgi:hypothetical protein